MVKLSIKTRIRSGFISVFAIMLLVAIYLFLQLQIISTQTRLLYEHPFRVSNAIQDIKTEFYKNSSLVKDIQLAGNHHQIDSLETETNNSDNIIQKDFKVVSLKYLGNKATVDSAFAAFTAWKIKRDQFYRLKTENKSDNSQALLKFDEQVNLERINYFLNIISNFADNKAENTFKKVIETENNSEFTSIILFLVSGLLIIFIIRNLTRSIERPIKAFVNEANILLKKDEKSKIVADEQIMLLTLAELKNAYLSIEKQDFEINLKNKELSEMNLKLEEKVKQRTAELDIVNKELERNIIKRTHELNDALELNLKIFETSPLGIIAFSEDGPCIFANESVAGISGATVEQMMKLNFRELDTWKENGLFEKAEITLKTHKTQKASIHIISTFKKEIRIRYHMSTFINKDKLNILMIVEDVTDLMLTEIELKKKTEYLELANKELEAFSYSVSHDLRAPLRHIGGFIELLLKGNSSRLDEAGIRYLNIISESSVEMGKLIDGLLTFSRLGRTGLQMTKFNCRDMINKVLKTFENELTGRKVEINLSELMDIKGDESLIRQVWVNLISNALKYSRNREIAVIDIGCKIEKDETIFHIKDNGVGFDMNYAGKLFGVFQRMHKATDFEGIGIGLANVNRIVIKHGGKCWAESELDKGATFFFSLPTNQ
jgi:PAS domain S-box-containing protein